jgi:hypothetical protein
MEESAWDKLTADQQKPYDDHAEMLLEKGYVDANLTVDQLAEIIYNKQNQTKEV